MAERDLNTLLSPGAQSFNQAAVSGPTPIPSLTAISPPMTSLQMVQTYFTPTVGSGGVMGAMAQGLNAARSLNAANPYNTMGAAMGMPPSYMMTDASMGIFRPGAGIRPPGLFSTPGMTGAFHSASDTASQYQLMQTGMFADPNQAGANYARMRVAQFGQKYGGMLGAAAGTIGGAAISGGGMMGMGATMGGAAGDWLGSNIGNIPVIGYAVRKAVELSNIGLTEQLSWMGGSQAATFGRVSMGGQDMGLGGRGMNVNAALRMGRQMRSMSVESGGQFNQMDMMNILRTAGENGFLDTATNADQVAKTVGNLMKIMGHLGKVMGDPDFRNNLKELGNLRSMGYSVNEALRVLPELNMYSRMGGMSRGQMAQQYGEPGAARAAAAGLTTGVGFSAGMYGGATSHLLQGSFNEIQKNLLGGEQGIAQRITEQQVAFSANIAPTMVLSLLKMNKGKLELDKAGIQSLMREGKIDLTRMAGAGAANVQDMARQLAQQNASDQGRTATAGDHQSAFGEIMSRMKEFQSDLTIQMGQRGVKQAQFNVAEGLRARLGDFGAASTLAGGDLQQAQVFMKEWRDPSYRDRMKAQIREEGARERGEDYLGASGRAAQRAEEHGRWGISRGLENFSRAIQRPSDLSESSIRDAEEMTRDMRRNELRMQGRVGVVTAGAGAGVSEHLKNRLAKKMKEGTYGGVDYMAGDAPVTQEELAAYHRRQGIDPGYIFTNASGRRAKVEESVLAGGVFLGSGLLMNESFERRKELTERVREDTKNIRQSGIEIAKAENISEEAFQKNYEKLFDTFGKVSSKGSGVAMTALKSELTTWAAKRGVGNLPIGSKDMAPVIIQGLIKGGMSQADAEKFYSKNSSFFTKFAYKSLSDSSSPDVQKALQATKDEALVSTNFGITEKGEKGIAQAEGYLAKAMQKAGATDITENRIDYSGNDVRTYSDTLSSAQKEAAREFYGIGEGENFSEGEESKYKSLVMLAARARGGTEAGGSFGTYVDSEEQSQAATILNSLRGSKDPKLIALLNKAEAKAKGMTAETRGGISGFAKLTNIDWTKGKDVRGSQDILSQLTKANEGMSGGLEAVYGVAAAVTGAESLTGVREEIREKQKALKKEGADGGTYEKKKFELLDYERAIFDYFYRSINGMPSSN